MRFVFALLCVCTLGVMHSVGCGEDGGEADACADWAGDWIVTSISCDDIAANTPDIEFRVAADCTGEGIIGASDTCTVTNQVTFTRETGDSTTLDIGAVTCSGECTAHDCQPLADGAMAYSATLIVTDDTWTLTALTTQQMVADEVTPCEAGETMVTVAVAK
jgi:hypothetical protein